MGRRHEQTFPQRRHPDGQLTHEKMFNITCHQGNTNQNHNEISPHTCQNGIKWTHRKWQMLARMRKKRNPFALLVGMQIGAATPENSMEVPQEIKNRTTLWPSNCTTRHLSTGHRCSLSKGHMHPHVYSSTWTIGKVCKQPNVHRWMNG